MTLTGIEFLYFCGAALAIYWLLPRRAALQNAWLLVCSYAFYVSWDWRLLGLILVGTAIDFFVGRELVRPDASAGAKRKLLALSLTWNLGALAFFKYEGFFADSLNELAESVGIHGILPHLSLVLPLGISFYTLQRISYVLDVYWGRHTARATPLQFALFSCFFPQLTAGPIARASELLPQLAIARNLSPGLVRTAALEILIGFALKAWAATLIGQLMVDPVYAQAGVLGPAAHIIAVIGYPLQVFADFGGYSLMAIGIARLFGIDLPINFNFPFLSTSLPEFWRRWHITLNRWLFDYIFTPATTSRGWWRGRFNAAMLATFLASGLWHGAAWTYVLWGALHGAGMIVHRWWDDRYRDLCRKDRAWVARRKTPLYRAVAWLLTIGFFALSLIPFRARDLSEAGRMVEGLLGAGSGSLGLGFEVNLLLAVPLIVLYHLGATDWGRVWVSRFAALPAPLRASAYGASIALLMLLTPSSPGTFIYQQF